MRIFLALVILLILGLLELLNPVRSLFQKFASPVQFGLYKSAYEIKDASKLFYNINEIRKDNLILIQENRNLTSTILELKKAADENEILKKQLNLKKVTSEDKQLLLASVMGNPSDLTGTSIMIDKGFRQGVRVGSNVILENFLVGIVDEVSPDRSRVVTVTSSNISITVENISTLSKPEGIGIGNAGTSILVTRLLPGDEVNVGDIFITSGKDGKFLPGLGVGNVSQVSYESADPLKSAILIPMADLSKLDKVFVILN